MNKKNIATTVVLLLCSCVFAVVGSCFMNFVYQDKKISVLSPAVVLADGVSAYDTKDESKTNITKLLLSDCQLGLKPVTGSADEETNIPSTVTDKNGSEGLYASMVVTAAAGLKFVVTNISVQSSEDSGKVNAQREHIFVGLKDENDGAKSLEEDVVELKTYPLALDEQEITFFVWLDSRAGDELAGATISFEIHLIYGE